MVAHALKAYGFNEQQIKIEPLTGGLINNTWKISADGSEFILQKINTHVFKRPHELAENVRMISDHLSLHHDEYFFVSPVQTINGDDFFYHDTAGYFRLFPFVAGSHTLNVVATPNQAFEAARQFGQFTKLLAGFNVTALHLTIPDFHNLTLRYRQFEESLSHGNLKRIQECRQLIDDIKNQHHILNTYEKIKNDSAIKQRVTHHDTKISNVLFDSHDKAICVIDLDTVMPGYYFSDVGDMMRTYLSAANEEEKNTEKIQIREDFFRGIVEGYLSQMADELNEDEQQLFYYSGLFLIYMQALRFLTDHLNNDIYYGARYENHNLVRANNQLHLLKRYEEKSMILQKIISDELKRKSHSFL